MVERVSSTTRLHEEELRKGMVILVMTSQIQPEQRKDGTGNRVSWDNRPCAEVATRPYKTTVNRDPTRTDLNCVA